MVFVTGHEAQLKILLVSGKLIYINCSLMSAINFVSTNKNDIQIWTVLYVRAKP